MNTIVNNAIKISIFVLLLTMLGMWGCPRYSVYQQNLEGEAELARATQNRQIKIQEANAVYESASKYAGADTVRAHGIARSNQIIGHSLKNNPEYLHWLWIDNIDKNPKVMYIPTEANMPILEAGRSIIREEK